MSEVGVLQTGEKLKPNTSIVVICIDGAISIGILAKKPHVSKRCTQLFSIHIRRLIDGF